MARTPLTNMSRLASSPTRRAGGGASRFALKGVKTTGKQQSQSPIGNLKHPFALSLAIVPATKVIDRAYCKSIFQIGDRRLRIADFWKLPPNGLKLLNPR
jgi:hypothetical protein